ncbi:MAG: YihY/virulence factor BrkB family protein, partial [Bacteroidota bacterium]
QISWLLVLFGAEISFANQNIERYEHESESLNISHFYRRILTLLIAKTVIRNFEQGNKPYTASEIAHKLGLPIRIVRGILFELTDANIFNEIISENIDKAFQPAVDIHKITVKYIIETLDKKGHDDIKIEQTEDLKKIAHAQESFFKAFEKTPENKLLKDI